MPTHHVTIVDSDGNRHRRGGAYIPRAKEKKRMERLTEKRAAGRAKSASAHAHRNGHTSVRSDHDEQESLIGGMKARDIGAQTYVMSMSIDRELSEEERHKIWQPPQRDTSRFKGTSASRHRAGTWHKDSADHPGGSFAADDELPPARKKKAAGDGKAKKKGRGGKASRRKS